MATEKQLTALADVLGAKTFNVGPSIVAEWYFQGERLGHASLIWKGAVVHWEGLWVRRPDTLAEFAHTLPGFFRGYNVKRVTAIGLKGLAWQWLEAVGFEPILKTQGWMTPHWHKMSGVSPAWKDDPASDLFVCHLTPLCRADEYTAWKRGEAFEPPWHQSVAQRRKAR